MKKMVKKEIKNIIVYKVNNNKYLLLRDLVEILNINFVTARKKVLKNHKNIDLNIISMKKGSDQIRLFSAIRLCDIKAFLYYVSYTYDEYTGYMKILKLKGVFDEK
jgi:hypothetical protein